MRDCVCLLGSDDGSIAAASALTFEVVGFVVGRNVECFLVRFHEDFLKGKAMRSTWDDRSIERPRAARKATPPKRPPRLKEKHLRVMPMFPVLQLTTKSRQEDYLHDQKGQMMRLEWDWKVDRQQERGWCPE